MPDKSKTKPVIAPTAPRKTKKRSVIITRKIAHDSGKDLPVKKTTTTESHMKGATHRDGDRLKTMSIEFGQRLRFIRTEHNLTQKEMGASINLSLLSYGRYENGTRMPDADVCAQIVLKYRVDPSWLLFGDAAEGMAKNKEETEQAKNYKAISVYELADASHENVLTMDTPTESITVPKTMVHRHSVAIIYRDGNMAPHINPGAVVGINKKVKETPMGHVYAVWVANIGTRLYRAYTNSLTEIALRSDNPSTPDIIVPSKEFQKVVLGRVEWLFTVYG